MDLGLEGKVVVIGGGAGGLGSALSKVLVEEGAIVEIADLKKGVDLSDPDKVREYFAGLRTKYPGGVGSYVSAVFGGTGTPLLQETPAGLADTIRHTLYAVVYPIVEAVRWMKETGGGHIVVVSSTNALVAAGEGAYDLAKSGINALARTLLSECTKYNISIVTLSPDTISGTSPWEGTEGREKALEMLDAMMPDGKVSSSEEIARVITFLLNPSARVFNGRNLVADGGFWLFRQDLEEMLKVRAN